MTEISNNPLLSLQAEDLEAAAYLSLAAGATTDLDQFPPGSGIRKSRRDSARRRRFSSAAEKVHAGETAIGFLGISIDDLRWAAEQADKAKDPESWRERFSSAIEELEEFERTINVLRAQGD